MNSIEFIKKELEKLNLKFPFCNFKYEYRSRSHSHVIEIIPIEIYNSSSFMAEEDMIDEKFMELFPTENLLFVSDESLNKVTEPIFEIKSKKQFRTLAELTSFMPVDMYPAADVSPSVNQAQMVDLNNFILVDMIQDEFLNVGNNNYALAA